MHIMSSCNFFQTGDQSASNIQTKIDANRQHKRERDKARNAKLTQEERNEKKHIILKKQKLH